MVQRLQKVNSFCLGDMAILSLTILIIATKQDNQNDFITIDKACALLPEFNKIAYGFHNHLMDMSGIRNEVKMFEIEILKVTDWTMPRTNAYEIMTVIFERIDIMSLRSKTFELNEAKSYALEAMWHLIWRGVEPGWKSIKRCVQEAIRSDERLHAMQSIFRYATNDCDFLYIKA